MDPVAIAKNAATIVVSVGAIIGAGSRLTILGISTKKHRLRNDIRENLALLTELEKNSVLANHDVSTQWLPEKIAFDTARLSGHPSGSAKKPIAWGSIVMAVVIGLPFGYWTSVLNRNGFVWLSIFPGLVSFLMAISILGMITDRQDESTTEGSTKK